MNNPCPFCGANAIVVVEGSTPRWAVAECAECEAKGPPVRKEFIARPISNLDKQEALNAWDGRA